MGRTVWAGAALLAGLPLLNALTTERHLLVSLQSGDWVFAGLELTLLALAALHAKLALRTRRHHAAASTHSGRKTSTPSATTAHRRGPQGEGASA